MAASGSVRYYSRTGPDGDDFQCDPFVQPQGEHKATIVWLHDKDDYYFDSVKFAKTLNLENVRWICPAMVYTNTFIKGVGGSGMGAVAALHFARNCALGHYPMNPQLVVGIDGWLSIAGSLKSSIDATVGAAARAASQSILLAHETDVSDDRRLPYTCDEEVVVSLREAGFGEVMFVPYLSLRRMVIRSLLA
ncbi:uncharacterized protein LOC17897985 isoform X2 [Capsella rubella]|uniref:uncharacterized protein LOC17897985 isoform X2 n=1 Tax=Capsella rubella TaxID=81985 RepID=UPI000CD50A62|nr:uncharacterized protein LOC17897985 isoform X2 [Capsella rubella]